MSDVLSVSSVSVTYGKIEAVRNVSIAMRPGQIVTIIGPNGAGKTSLLGAIMGLLPSTGTISFNGEDLARLDVEARVERGMCLVPERRELFSGMSVADNLLLGAFGHRSDKDGIHLGLDKVYQLFPPLAERRRQLAHSLSGGEQQMLALGRALMAQPRLLLLDEPSLGLAPLMVKEIFKVIASLGETGVSILLVEQNARAALESADFGYVIETGEIVLSAPAIELIHHASIMAAYLGGKV
jgi:branched-chain amino acid transport system ATP-binding protein